MKDLTTKTKVLASSVLAVMSCASFPLVTNAATSTSNGINLTVSTSWSAAQLPNWPQLISQFEKIHPDVSVTLSFTSGSAAVQQVHAEFISGTAPDIVMVFKKDFNQYQQAGYLTNLTPWLKKIGWYNGYFNPGALHWSAPVSQAFSPNPTVYGVPDFMQPSVFFYNVGIFKKLHLKVPTNIPQLIAVSQKLKAAGIKPLVVDAGDGSNNDMDVFAKAVAQFAGAKEVLAVDNGKAKFTDAPFMAAAKEMQQLVQAGVIDKSSVGLSTPECESLVANGQAAIFSLHTSQIPVFESMEQANPNFKFGLFPYFNFTNKQVSPYTVTFGGSWVIPKTSKHVKQAEEFLQFMFSKQNIHQTVEQNGLLSDIPSADKGFTNPIQKLVDTQMIPKVTSAQAFYLIDMLPPEFQKSIGSGMQELIAGKIDYKTWMQNAQSTMDQVLAQQK